MKHTFLHHVYQKISMICKKDLYPQTDISTPLYRSLLPAVPAKPRAVSSAYTPLVSQFTHIIFRLTFLRKRFTNTTQFSCRPGCQDNTVSNDPHNHFRMWFNIKRSPYLFRNNHLVSLSNSRIIHTFLLLSYVYLLIIFYAIYSDYVKAEYRIGQTYSATRSKKLHKSKCEAFIQPFLFNPLLHYSSTPLFHIFYCFIPQY